MTYIPEPCAIALETVIRDLLAEIPDLPVRAFFYRGRTGRSGPLDPWTRQEEAETPGCPDEWFVQLRPSSFDVVVSAAGRYEFGAYDVIGSPIEVKLPRIKGRPDAVDVDAFSGSKLHVELLAAIREKAAVVEQVRAAAKS